MLDFMFFVKTLALTFLLMVALQTRVGEGTIEDHAMNFVRTSALTQPLHRIASSGAQVIRTSTNWLAKQVNQRLRKPGAQEAALGGRGENFQFKRSEGFERKKAETEAARQRGQKEEE